MTGNSPDNKRDLLWIASLCYIIIFNILFYARLTGHDFVRVSSNFYEAALFFVFLLTSGFVFRNIGAYRTLYKNLSKIVSVVLLLLLIFLVWDVLYDARSIAYYVRNILSFKFELLLSIALFVFLFYRRKNDAEIISKKTLSFSVSAVIKKTTYIWICFVSIGFFIYVLKQMFSLGLSNFFLQVTLITLCISLPLILTFSNVLIGLDEYRFNTSLEVKTRFLILFNACSGLLIVAFIVFVNLLRGTLL